MKRNRRRANVLFYLFVAVISICGEPSRTALAGEPTAEPFAPKQDTLPAIPPKDAIVLFDGKGTNLFLSMQGGPIDWPIVDGTLVSTRGKGRTNHLVSRLHFRDADMHVEFMLPKQGSGNSGVYIHGNYELQIFNSVGKKDAELSPGDMGGIYGFYKPLANACRQPGQWQVYDIRYRAPRRNKNKQIVQDGSITAFLNGVKVQDHATFNAPRSRWHPFRYGVTPYLKQIWERQQITGVGPVFLQDHDNNVKFRNVWVRPLDDYAFLYEPTKSRTGASSSTSPRSERTATFTKHVLTETYYCDGINQGDFNRDGDPDVVAGPFWYEGPDFKQKHAYYPAVAHEPAKSPTDCMFCYVHDFNQDQWPDILVLGRVHLHAAYWYENPRGQAGLWKKHYVFERIQGENPPFTDLSGDGKPELVCHWQNQWGWVCPDWNDPTKPWSFHPITEVGEYNRFYHGTGVGDIDGDGRVDLILNAGWWRHPETDAESRLWSAFPTKFSKSRGGAQMYAYDVDGDGDNDVITALDAHGWGLAWFEQVRSDNKITFVEHVIMADRSQEKQYGVAFSQPHALDIADVDADGLTDIIVGKRRWAHGPEGDIEPNAAPVVYWFQLKRNSDHSVEFRPHLIDDNSGVGLQVIAADMNGDKKLDILSSSKLGAFVFIQD